MWIKALDSVRPFPMACDSFPGPPPRSAPSALPRAVPSLPPDRAGRDVFWQAMQPITSPAGGILIHDRQKRGETPGDRVTAPRVALLSANPFRGFGESPPDLTSFWPSSPFPLSRFCRFSTERSTFQARPSKIKGWLSRLPSRAAGLASGAYRAFTTACHSTIPSSPVRCRDVSAPLPSGCPYSGCLEGIATDKICVLFDKPMEPENL